MGATGPPNWWFPRGCVALESQVHPGGLWKVCRLWILWYWIILEPPSSSLSKSFLTSLAFGLCSLYRREKRLENEQRCSSRMVSNVAREQACILGDHLPGTRMRSGKKKEKRIRSVWLPRAHVLFWASVWDARTRQPRQDPWVYHRPQPCFSANERTSCSRGRTARASGGWLQPWPYVNAFLPCASDSVLCIRPSLIWNLLLSLRQHLSSCPSATHQLSCGNYISPASSPNRFRGLTPHATHLEDGWMIEV